LAADGQPGRAVMMALDVEPLAVEANQLLQGLAVLSRIVRDEQDVVNRVKSDDGQSLYRIETPAEAAASDPDA
jgi:hypothetical protein